MRYSAPVSLEERYKMQMNAAKIQKSAISGGARSGIDFLASEAVAVETADRLWAYLRKHGYESDREKLIKVIPSRQYKGTWRVEFYSGLRQRHSAPGAASNNKRRREFAREALQSALREEDLVKSWPL